MTDYLKLFDQISQLTTSSSVSQTDWWENEAPEMGGKMIY